MDGGIYHHDLDALAHRHVDAPPTSVERENGPGVLDKRVVHTNEACKCVHGDKPE